MTYIKRRSVEIANDFVKQKMTWARRYTWEELLKGIGLTVEEAKREGWKPENFSHFTYDQKEKLFYVSEEHYRKSKEN
jgi:hypothetical protein